MSVSRLAEIVRKAELLISVQIENLRAIDGRATRLMTGIGTLLSIVFGFLSLSNVDFDFQTFDFFSLFIAIAVMSGVIGIMFCLIIIQSDTFNPPGNDAWLLLKDISDGYTQRGEMIDYICNLSESKKTNENLITRNGRFLKIASWCFLLMLLGIITAGFFLA